MQLVKQVVARFPDSWQTELKRIHFKRQISRGKFVTNEPEYAILHEFLRPGDWVVDVGANVGHYTKRCSDLVGSTGRVIAFEPVPSTFSLLASNTQRFANPNVTLINAAVSDKLSVVGMEMPRFSSGLKNYYQAHLSSSSNAALHVLTLSLDALRIDQRVALVKIDAEGHEMFVLSGMRELIERHRPVLIVEASSEQIEADLMSAGYAAERLSGSPNVLFRPNK